MTTLVLHGAQRPAEDVVSAVARDLRAVAGAGAQVVEAFETSGAARGAAANVAAALANSTGTLVLVVAVDPQGRTAPVDALLDAASQRNCLAVADAACQAARWKAVAASSDLLDAIVTDTSGLVAGRPSAARPAFVPAWAAPRAVIERAGGLDARWLHVGESLDLALRVLDTGGVVESLPVTGPASSDVYPLPAGVAEFLAWQHATLIALERPGIEESGRLTAWVAAQALTEAWRAAALDVQSLRFGEAWPEQARADRWLGRTGLRRNATFWPRDEGGTVVPFLALDAAIERFTKAEPRPSPVSGRTAPQTGAEDDPTSVVDHTPEAGEPVGTSRASSPYAASVVGTDRPTVSVIVVNWNGEEHLTPCFTSLLASDYPADRLELICVDNGSTDGSRGLLAATFPTVKVVALDENRGFTGGNIAGVEVARGEVLAFFNNDMRVEPDAVRRLVDVLDDAHPCAAARVLSWDGQRIDFVRGTLNFEARGFQENYGEPVRPELCAAGETFFANGGAFAITRDAYQRAGGFDASLFAYYDDTDLGWGVRINGGSIRGRPRRHRLSPPRRDREPVAGGPEAVPHGAQRRVDGGEALRRAHARPRARADVAAGGAARRAGCRGRPLVSAGARAGTVRATRPGTRRGEAVDVLARVGGRKRLPRATDARVGRRARRGDSWPGATGSEATGDPARAVCR